MKKVYNFEQSIYIKGQTHDFQPTSIWKHYMLLSDEEVVAKEGRWTFPTFDDLWNFVADGNIWNAEHLTGRYTRKIRFKCGIESYTVFEKRYHEVTLWHHFKEKKSASIKDLMDNLSADDMVEYLRERGIGLEIRG